MEKLVYVLWPRTSLAGESADAGTGVSNVGSKFHYTKQVLSGNQAVLEFESEVGGKYVNGVDIIECNAEGRILTQLPLFEPALEIVDVEAEADNGVEPDDVVDPDHVAQLEAGLVLGIRDYFRK